jgi:hypothetical protein
MLRSGFLLFSPPPILVRVFHEQLYATPARYLALINRRKLLQWFLFSPGSRFLPVALRYAYTLPRVD